MVDSEPNNEKTFIQEVLSKIARLKNITNYQLEPFVEAEVGDGFVSQMYKGDIINKDTREIISVAIKVAPKWDWDYSKIFQNEINFYQNVVPALDLLQKEANLSNQFNNIPKFLTSGTEAKKEYVAMENLKSKGYVLHDKRKCFDKEQLEFIFRTYGKFHALSFVLRKQNLDKYKQIHQDYTDVFSLFTETESSAKFFSDAFTVAVEALNPDSPVYKEVKDLPKNWKTTLLKSFIYDGDYRCSTHGDCWSNNMLFLHSDSGKLENMKLIDFQLARDGTPIHDLSYFFYSGAGKTDLDNIKDYLKIYHNSLSETITGLGENPEEIFPFDTLIKEWKENAFMGVLLGIYLWQFKLIPKEEYVDILKDNNTSRSKPGDDEFIAATEQFNNLVAVSQKNNVFREISRNILLHAFDFGVLRKEKIILENDNNVSVLDNVIKT